SASRITLGHAAYTIPILVEDSINSPDAIGVNYRRQFNPIAHSLSGVPISHHFVRRHAGTLRHYSRLSSSYSVAIRLEPPRASRVRYSPALLHLLLGDAPHPVGDATAAVPRRSALSPFPEVPALQAGSSCARTSPCSRHPHPLPSGRYRRATPRVWPRRADSLPPHPASHLYPY